MNYIKLLLFIGFAFNKLNTAAQTSKTKIKPITFSKEADNLQPVSGIFGVYNSRFDYYARVRNVLFLDSFSFVPVIRFVALSSFTSESALIINRDFQNNKYYLTYRISKKNIWHATNNDTLEFNEIVKEIPFTTVELLKNLFSEAISKARYPKRNMHSGLDGTSYIFILNERGIKSGRSGSPKKGTKVFELVEICSELIELVKITKENLLEIDSSFYKKIKRLTKRF